MVDTLTDDTTGTVQIGDRSVRRMGFGAMRLTGEGIWGPPDDPETCREVLRRVVELGVNFIDTADSYGPEVSEELIAETLHPYPDDLLVATKGGLERTGPGQWPRNGHPEHLKQACEGSLRRLQVDTVELYQLHSPDREVPYEESVGALKELQDEGKIHRIGISNVSVDQLRTAQSIIDVESVQNRYNLADRGSQDVLDACDADGIAFIPWFPLGASDLTEDDRLRDVADRHDATPAQIALTWLLHASPVTLPIPGTSSLDHLEENVGAAHLDLTDEDLDELDGLSSR